MRNLRGHPPKLPTGLVTYPPNIPGLGRVIPARAALLLRLPMARNRRRSSQLNGLPSERSRSRAAPVTHGLVVRNSSQHSADANRITRDAYQSVVKRLHHEAAVVALKIRNRRGRIA
jgi:hypothetical protein